MQGEERVTDEGMASPGWHEAAEPETEAPEDHGPETEVPRSEAPAPAPRREYERRPQQSARTPPTPRTPASPAAIQGAIDDVNQIVENLKEALDNMEEVLETLEFAERQKTADEQEIESLRRSLRHLQKPREGGPPQQGRRH